MARKRKGEGASRVTPKGSHSRSGTGAHRQRTDDATLAELRMLSIEAVDCIEHCNSADLDGAEESVSCMIGIFTTSNWNADGVSAGRALTHAETIGGPAGAVIAAGIAAYGERGLRKRARRVLQRFVDDDVDVPAWVTSLGVAEPLRVVKIRDEWDEHSTLVIDYARPDGSVHELWASLHPFSWGMAHNFSVLPATAVPDRTVAADHVIEAVSLEDARRLLDRGLGELDEGLRLADAVVFDEFGRDADLRSLVGQRVELLPTGGDSAVANEVDGAQIVARTVGAVAEFLDQPFPLGERDADVADLLTSVALFSEACQDKDMLRWTPPRIKSFLEFFLPGFGYISEHDDLGDDFDPSDEWLATLDLAFPRWLRFAAARQDAGAELLEANLAAARDSLQALRRELTGSPLPYSMTAAQWN